MNHADLSANLQRGFSIGIKKKKGNTPSNLLERDVIKTCQHFFFHLPKGPCMASNAEPELRSAPILLDEI
jgi:hypothetical protein